MNISLSLYFLILLFNNYYATGMKRRNNMIRSVSSVIYKVFLNEFQNTNNKLRLENSAKFSCNTTLFSNSIRILNANNYFKASYLRRENKVLLKMPHRQQKHKYSMKRLVKLNKNENLVKIELFLVNKFNLKLNIRLCNIHRGIRRCKTLVKSNKNFLIRLNLTNRKLNSYLVIKTSSTSQVLFEKSLTYFLIANLFDRLKCETENQQQKLTRQKRSNDFENEPADNQCKRIIQRVDFNKIFGSKNLIIQPNNYIAYRCEGTCDFKSTHYSKFASNHSTIQSLYNWLKPNSIERPCCVPVKYKPLYLLNYDINNEIVMKQHENMIVDTCGCV